MLRKLMLITVLCCFIFSGCQKKQEDITSSLLITTSFYPVAILTLNITNGIEGVEVRNMAAPQTGCLHDYQMTTKDMKLLEQSDLFVINGGEMESFLNQALEFFPKLPITDSSIGISMLSHDHSHEGEKAEGNAHFWLSVSDALKQAENIKNALVELDPAHKNEYEENFMVFQKSVKPLEEEMEELNFEGITVGIFHEGFDYFAQQLHMNVGFEILIEENETSSAKELSLAIEKARDEKIKLLFVSDGASKKVADSISQDSSAKVIFLNPLTSGELTAESYYKIMKQNISVLKEALRYANS